MTRHPSSLQLERFSVDDLPVEAREGTRVHVDSCPDCTRFLNGLDQARAECLRAIPPEELLRRIATSVRPQLPRWSWLGLGAAAIAAGLLLVLLLPVEPIRLKGAGVAVYRKRGDEVQILRADQNIRAGDSLRVVVSLPRRTPIAAWFLDARGRVDRFLADGSVPLDRGEQALPGSAVVESPCVDLWLMVVTGSGATQRLESAFQRAQTNNLPPGEGWAPSGAVVRPLRCE
jgi:hypothetical protein